MNTNLETRTMTEHREHNLKIAIFENEYTAIKKKLDIDTFHYIKVKTNNSTFYIDNNELANNSVILNTIVYLYISDAAASILHEFDNKFCKHVPFKSKHINVSKLETKTLYKIIIDTLLMSYQTIISNNCHLRNELYIIRNEYDKLQESFRSLEKYAEDNFVITEKELLNIEFTGKTIEASNKHQENTIIQNIPLASSGLSAIAIYFPEINILETGYIEIALRTIEDDNIVSKWILKQQNLGPGWIKLALNKALGVDEFTPAIEISNYTDSPINIGLAIYHPDKHWCARTCSTTLDSCLAMKAFKTIPGISTYASYNSRVPKSIRTSKILLQKDILQKVVNFSESPENIKYIEYENSILVHPQPTEPTLAIISDINLNNIIKISADINLSDKADNDVKFMIGIGRHKGKSLQKHKQVEIITHSDWTILQHGESSHITLLVPKSIYTVNNAVFDICLMTKVRENKSNAWCEAYFKQIAFESNQELNI